MSATLVENCRISAQNRHDDLPQFVKSGPLFLESRNFFSIPKQSKGTLVAFQRQSEGKSKWKLGIVNCIYSVSQICEIFVWNGPTIHHTNSDQNQDSLYPQFYFWQRGELNSPVIFEGQVYMKWQFHFTLLTIDINQFCDF